MVPCWYCGTIESGPRLREHQIPKCRGGGEGDNLVPACYTCNRNKGSKTVEEYRAVIEIERRHSPHKFYGEIHTIVAPTNYWKRAFTFSCTRCLVESPAVRTFVALVAVGWRSALTKGERLCPTCQTLADEESDQWVRDMIIDRALRELDDCYDLGGSC
jgi:hypothetical protein